jgi:alanine dehydrogenase
VLIGVPKEIKVEEHRVGLTPESVRQLVATGHRVLVQAGAGAGIGASDADYRAAGAAIALGAADIFGAAELIVKVKEPLAPERALLRPGQALFTYLHLAPDPEQARGLLASGALAIAYETVTSPQGGLPLLAPMSEVAGRMAVQVAAHYLERPHGGRGVLLSGATGVPAATVLVLKEAVVTPLVVVTLIGLPALLPSIWNWTVPLGVPAAVPGALTVAVRVAD